MSLCLLALTGNERMATSLADILGRTSDPIELHNFPDGETSLRINVDLAGREVAIVCTLDRPNEKLAPLLFAADLARDLGATSVGLIAPYLAYMRQDMRFNPGESVTARYFPRIVSTNFDWLVTVDPHLHRIAALQEVYDIPAIAARSAPAIGAWIRANVDKPGLIGPDAESLQWVSEVARHADAPFMVLEKIRGGDHDVAVNVVGNAAEPAWIKQCTAVIVDDIASTARTLIAALQSIKAASGARPVCVVVHAVFSGDAYAALSAAGAAKVVSCDTVVHGSNTISISRELAAGAIEARKAAVARSTQRRGA